MPTVAANEPANRNHFAVVVGIDRYPGIGDLGGARADANLFAAWLCDPEGGSIPSENVKQITVSDADQATFARAHDARPTNVEIDYALQEVTGELKSRLAANSNCWEESRIYLYAAGHGFAPQGGEGALFLANAEPDALVRNIELAQYRRWCTSCAWAREVVVFVDCCRTRIDKAVQGLGPLLDECKAPWNGKSSAWVIGYGSSYGKPTYEPGVPGSDDQARGYFTAALIEGLRGGAPRDSSGAITAATLSGYVKSLVTERTREQAFLQDADIVGPLAADIKFGTAVAPPTRRVTLVLPARFSGKARIVKDGRVIDTWDGQSSEWTVELADGVYEAEGGGFAGDGLFKVLGEDRRVEL